MSRNSLPALLNFARAWRSWLDGCVVGLACLTTGCAEFRIGYPDPVPARIVRASGDRLTVLPAPETVQPAAPAAVKPASTEHSLAINLDTVFRLAEDQNSQVALARAKVDEAWAAKSIADKSWLPSLNVGVSYFRHEGGISFEDGTLIRSSFSSLFPGMEINSKLDLREAVYVKFNAERQTWQQRGELRRITSETLLDAASTYIDLLSARTGEAIALAQLRDLEDLLGRAQKLADPNKGEPGARIEAVRIGVQQRAWLLRIEQLREQGRRASAKLAYLLGVDPDLTLIPVDEKLVPMDLVDPNVPVRDRVAQALQNGPGVQELEGLLALIQRSSEQAKGPCKYLPVFEMRMIEGGFGTGPGDQQTWDNRFDLGLQARWNLMELVTAGDRQRLVQAKTEQAHLAYQDLRGKLTAGVQEALEAVVSGKRQMRFAQEQVQEARQAYDLSEKRQQNFIQGSTYSEVLLSLESVALAQASYLHSIRDYDKAQLRLLLLLGAPAAGDGNCSGGGVRQQ